MIRQHSSRTKLFGLFVPLALCAMACSSSSDGKNTDKGPPKGTEDGGPQGGDPDSGSQGGDPDAGNLDAGGGGAPTVEQFCTHLAARAGECGAADPETKAKQCKDLVSAPMPKWRDDVVTATDECIQTQDCKVALSSNAILACLQQAAKPVEPTPAVAPFCKAFKSTEAKCERVLDEAECKSRWHIYKDDSLAEITNCTKTEKDCEKVRACVFRTAGLEDQ